MNTKRIGLALSLLAICAVGIANAASVEPILYEDWQSGDAKFECGQVACCDADFSYKFDEWEKMAYDGPYVVDGGNVITISNDDGVSFDWTSEWPVSCVIVKGGPSANVYCYDPPVYGDTGMFAPTNPNNPNNEPYDISHVTFCYNEADICYQEETAWATGTRYVTKGNWAMYVKYDGAEKTVDLIAAQNVIAGTVTFSAPVDGWVTITVNLTGGAIFYYDANDEFDDNLKVQDYATAPNTTPAPGQFDWKEQIPVGSTTGEIVVPANNFYGVHVDLALPVPCVE